MNRIGGDGPTVRGLFLLRARSCLAALLLRAYRLAEPGAWSEDTPAAMPTGRGELDPRVRRRVVENLEADLEGLVGDAAERAGGEDSFEILLTTVAILRWLRDDGELPPPAAVEALEVHAAVFNGARQPEERALQRGFRDVLGALVVEQTRAIVAERWRARQVNREAAEERERRRFAARLEGLRRSRGLSIGELARGSGLEIVEVVELIAAAREIEPDEIHLLARALGSEPGELIPGPDATGTGAA